MYMYTLYSTMWWQHFMLPATQLVNLLMAILARRRKEMPAPPVMRNQGRFRSAGQFGFGSPYG